MKRLILFLVLVSAAVIAQAAPLPGNGGYVTLNNAPLYQDNPDKSLKYLEGLTLGDVVTVQGRTATFKESGNDRLFMRVKAPDGKEGWVRPLFVAPKSSLAVVKSSEAIIFSEPRYVKATSRFASPMTVVAVLADGSSASFARVQGYDVANKAFLTEQAYLSTDDLSLVDADVQAAVLYAVAMDAKSPDVKKSLLKLAFTKYSTSLWGDAIGNALNGGTGMPGAAPGAAPGAMAAPAAAVPSKSLLDSGDVHVAYVAGTVAPNATTHNIVQMSRGDSTANEYVDGLVTDISAAEYPLGQSKAIVIQAVAQDKNGKHGSVVVYSEDPDGFTKLGGPWDSPAGGTIEVAGTTGGGAWASFKVKQPDAGPAAGSGAPALYLSYDDGQNQYVPEDYTGSFQVSAAGFFGFNDDQINMRDSPSTTGKVVATLSQSDLFQILDRSEDQQTIGGVAARWYRILPKGSAKSGWVFGGFIQAAGQ